MITLTQEERTKFAMWLEQEVETDNKLIVQMKKIPIPVILHKLRNQEMESKAVVAKILRSINTQVIQ